LSRDATGTLLVNAGTVPIANGPATLANTGRIVAAGYESDDVITLDETNGPLVSAELQGGDGNDTLTAGSGADRLFGDAGNDVLFGRGGDDELSGGDGDDQLDGGNGADALFDGLGDDVLRGGDGDDTLFVGEGDDDELFGEAGNDRLTYFSSVSSSGGHGVLDGGSGDDILAYYLFQPDSPDLATLVGGDGYDRIKAEAGPGGYLTIDAGGDADLVEIVASKTDYEIALGSGSDVLRISGALQTSSPAIVVTDFAAGDNGDALDLIAVLARSLYNWDFDDNPFAVGFLRVEQRGGDAVLQVNVGASGDGGFQDFIVLQNVSVGALTARNLGGYAADGSKTVGITIEGTVTPDFVSGTSGRDILRGFDGADGLFGGAGADILRGGAGDDTLDGQLGDDIVHGGTGNDTIRDAFDGNDELYGGDGDDFIFADRQWVSGSQQLLIDGGADNDELHFLGAPGRHDATLFGGSGNDTISVHIGRNVTIDAGEGADYVVLDIGIANSVVALGGGIFSGMYS
jgi:Ca2+-binding RTX toxin-like protein